MAATSLLTALTTTDDYQAWAHGFALTASLFAARRVLAELVERPGASLQELCARITANAGHLAIMLRTLSTVGWVKISESGTYSTSRAVAECAACSTLATLCMDVYGEEEKVAEAALSAEAWGHHLPRLAKHLGSIQSGWALPPSASEVALLPLMLAGSVITPLLLELRMISSSYTAKADAGEHEHASSTVTLRALADDVAHAVGGFFAFQKWGVYDGASKTLSLKPDGLFIIERCPAFGVCLSYRPMLHQLAEATFGDVKSVFAYEGEHEGWVDRKLNVIGSGFMHNRYFADMMSVHVAAIFDEPELARQPKAVADMGCGDGTLLKTIYLYVAKHTLRGKHLQEYPLLMIGVDFNRASEEETSKTLELAGIPTHGTMFGDIGDPVPMQAALQAKFRVTRDEVLHVRSFLDHDRPFISPTKPADALVEAAFNHSDAAYVENVGGTHVSPSLAFYSLVEHFERWAQCLGVHGLLVLEVSNLDCVTTRKFMHEATSMHFDCVQMHSGQILMPPTHFSLGAATAGLLPSSRTLTYPKDSPYTRIVLQQLKPAGLRIRLATLADMDSLLQLETHWRSDDLSSDEETLSRRLNAHPTGQYVVEACTCEAGGTRILGAMYTQRVPSYESLLTCTRATELAMHTSRGPVIQLLGVVQAPDAARVLAGADSAAQRSGGSLPRVPAGESRSVGQILRDYVLHLGRLDATAERACGVTRCRDFNPGGGRSYEEHVAICEDAGLKFHSDAGAVIGEIVPGYRTGDAVNGGRGVMICYELKGKASTLIGTNALHKKQKQPQPHGASAAATGGGGGGQGQQAPDKETGPPQTLAQTEAAVCEAIDALRYGDAASAWTPERKREAFMDLGVDSLDATKFVQSLNASLGLSLSTTVIFEAPNVCDLAEAIFEELKSRPPPPSTANNHNANQQPGPKPPFKMAPPSDDAFYLRGGKLPYYMIKDAAAKKGVPEGLVELWAAQRQAKQEVTPEILDAARRMMRSECF